MLSFTTVKIHPSRNAEFEAWRATRNSLEQLELVSRDVDGGYKIILAANGLQLETVKKFREPLN